MKWWPMLLLSVLFVGTGILSYVLYENWREHRFDSQIKTAAQRYNVDPALVKAVVRQESRFNPNARGRAGEVGLMQLRELSAREWASSQRLTNFAHMLCLDPLTNTLAGTFYLGKLLRRYSNTDNPVPYALADYNAGRSYVIKWNTNSASTNSAAFIEQIGFPSTKNYVKSVMKRTERYKPEFAAGQK